MASHGPFDLFWMIEIDKSEVQAITCGPIWLLSNCHFRSNGPYQAILIKIDHKAQINYKYTVKINLPRQIWNQRFIYFCNFSIDQLMNGNEIKS